ncbi:MAG: GntR family transcriptional regulator [Clostridia bacterium]|nr:GntR family transcriptional regulator [Clostridia bacterium]
MIKLDYKNPKPLHEQITQGIKDLVMCGGLTADEQLPSVRELSVSLTVNPNTVQRAYRTLEADGIIYSIRGKGNFVAGSHEATKRMLDKLYSSLSENVRELAFYGVDEKQITDIVRKIYQERNEADD